MAQKRQPAGEAAKPNKFKFVYIEADLSETNFSELTSTIAQVMRPPAAVRQISNGRQPAALAPAQEVVDAIDVTDAEYEEVAEPAAEPGETAAKPPRPPRQKKLKPPEYLPDLLTDREAFKTFAKEKAPTSKNKQY